MRLGNGCRGDSKEYIIANLNLVMKHITASGILAVAAAVPASASGKAPKQPQPAECPNIVYIMCDDHSYQAISAYGHPLSRQAPTPNIDRLARNGMLFTRAYVENSLSTPSRACLMTGLYSHQNGQRMLGRGIDSTRTFFSELLQASGYQTGVVGKWHLQCEPKGFDYFCVLNDQGDYYNPTFRTPDSGGKYVREEGYVTERITDHSLEFLENRDPSRPFCLLVHHKAPHRNWMPALQYLTLYEDVEFPMPANFYDDYATRGSAAHTQQMSVDKDMTMIYDLKVDELKTDPAYRRENQSDGWKYIMSRLTPEQQAVWHAAYGPSNRRMLDAGLSPEELVKWKYQRYIRDYMRCIKSVDEQVGRLLDYLEAEGLTENTIIVYTSDQGFYMGEHGWFDKRFMYEESFRTPLIVCYPSHIKAGSVNDALVQNIDYAPTFLDLAGIAVPQEMSGRPLTALFGGKTPKDWREYLYYHYYDYPAVHYVRRHDGVSDGRYKLIHFYGKGYDKDAGQDADYSELYDLRSDLAEMNNLYGQPGYGKITARLQQQLNQFRDDLQVDEY